MTSSPSRFTPQDRRLVLEARCRTPKQIGRYRERWVQLIALRAKETARILPEAPSFAWEDAAVPEVVLAYAASVGVAPPCPAGWAQLSELQRFALVKLTRPGHDNVNFLPVLREFGLLA